MASDTISWVRRMISLHTFFRKKMAPFVMMLFGGILLVANVSVFVLSSIQYQSEIEREQSSFTAMMVHLYTMESTDTAITYAEHYHHTSGIDIAFYEAGGQLLYQTDDDMSMETRLSLTDDGDREIGWVYYDDQTSYLGSELSWGLLVMNGISILTFLLFLKIFYVYLNGWESLMKKDFARIGHDKTGYHFKDLHDVGERLKTSLETKQRTQDLQKHAITTLAHDIKTPLTVIKTTLDGIRLGRLRMDESTIGDLSEEIKAIEAMVPKIMAGDESSLPVTQNIKPLIVSIIDRLSDVFESKHLTVTTELDDIVMTIAPEDVTRILEHLLFNAYYYNKEGGSIDIRLDGDAGNLTVQDTGIGMDEETLNHLTKTPYRSEEAKKHNKKGSGTGLLIVDEIVRRNRLSMVIESRLDAGTTVTIDLAHE